MKVTVRPGVEVDIGEPDFKPISAEARARLWVLLADWRAEITAKLRDQQTAVRRKRPT